MNAPTVTLRGRQPEWVEKVEEDLRAGFTRMLFCAAGGAGKTVVFGHMARKIWERYGLRSLITVNRQSIVQQTARRIAEESGLECSVEMGDETASPYSPCVVASVQSLSKINRLTGFSDSHFGYVFPDEAHFSIAPGSLRINNYFHYGAESLDENWLRPPDGAYTPKARVIGFSVGPESTIELRGGIYGAGFVGYIEEAFSLAAKENPICLVGGFEIVRLHGVEARGFERGKFSWKTCKKIIRHAHNKACVSLKFHGGHSLTLTKCHSVYVARRRGDYTRKNKTAELSCIKSNDLVVGDILIGDDGRDWNRVEEPVFDLIEILGKIKTKTNATIGCDLSGITFRDIMMAGASLSGSKASKSKSSLGVSVFLKIGKSIKSNDIIKTRHGYINRYIRLSEWAYLLGFWLGDGWISGSRVSFAVENNAVDYIYSKMRSMMGVKWNPVIRKMRGASCEIRASNIGVSALMNHVFGTGVSCHSKFIPGFIITSWSVEQKKELIRGLLDSDGYSTGIMDRNKLRHCYVTMSRRLAYSLASLLRSIGIRASISKRKPSLGGIIGKRRVGYSGGGYHVNWSGWTLRDNAPSDRCGGRAHFTGGHGLRFSEARVRSIDEIKSPDFVYDLEMNGHPSFVADGVLVHNTATPEEKLLEWYQHVTVKYPYFQAVKDGVLVPVVQESIPVRVDLRKKKIATTGHGRDFKDADVAEQLAPVIEELADQVVARASNRKTIAFLPSVDTAKMLSDALCRRGLKSVFVSGQCEDGDAKTDYFRQGGAGYVLCNAQIYNFGIDFPDCDCVAWFRATISKSFFLQGAFRASRVLPGVIDGIEDADARRAAIAASRKPNFLLLDPLFVTDRADLCDAYDLYCEKAEVKDQMKASGELSPESAEKAERDFVKALNKAARKVQNRQARIIDPLAWGVTIGLERLRDYHPETEAESRPVTPEQIAFLEKQHISMEGIKCRGAASLVIGTYLKRLTLKLATPEQLSFMERLGLPVSPTVSRADASRAISAKLGR